MSSPSPASPPPAETRSAGLLGGCEEEQPLGDGARAHVGLEDALDRADTEAGLLLGLGPDARLGQSSDSNSMAIRTRSASAEAGASIGLGAACGSVIAKLPQET